MLTARLALNTALSSGRSVHFRNVDIPFFIYEISLARYIDVYGRHVSFRSANSN